MQRFGRPGALRLASIVLLAACALQVWHILVMRRYIEAPAIVAMWLTAGAVFLIIVMRPTRTGVVFVGVGAVLLFLFHWGFERAASDGREYFIQVRSLVMDRDLDFANDNAVLGGRGAAKMYPFGAAILWAPFMVLAHAWLGVLNLFGGSYSIDGYTNPYQRAIGLGTLAYGFTGLVLIQRVLRDYFDEAMAVAVTIAIAAGTFFLWYVTVENSMSHGASMFATTLFLYVWHRGRPRTAADGGTGLPSTTWWAGLGLAAGLMTMVRWQNVTFAGLAVLLSLWSLRRTRGPAVRGAIVFSAGAFVAFLPQLAFWKVVRGAWFSVPAADHVFDVRALHGLDVLFSPNHGLLSTTPLVYLALIGLPLFVRRDVPMALVLIGGLLSQVFINGGNDGWWGGPGFGARRFDNSLLVFSVGLASLVAWLRRRPLVAPLAVIAVLVGVNAAVMADVRRQTLRPSEAITFTDAMASVYARVGNPFSFPYNAYVAWRYDADWALYDRLKGRTFSNIDLDFGDAGDDMFLGHGWLGPERNETTSYRWASGTTATIVVPLKPLNAFVGYRLEFVCRPAAAPGLIRQTVDVMVNRVRAARIALQPGMDRYQVDIPASAWRANLNQIQFVFGYSIASADEGRGNDARPLAVMFDSLRLKVLTGNAP